MRTLPAGPEQTGSSVLACPVPMPLRRVSKEDEMLITETPIEIAKKALEAFNEKDMEELLSLYHEDIVYKEVPYNLVIYGPEEVEVRTLEYWKAFPDMRGEVVNILPGEETVGFEVVWTGTHTGQMVTPFGTFPPTGKVFTNPAFVVLSFKGGKIVGFTHYFDTVTTLMQLELIPNLLLKVAPI